MAGIKIRVKKDENGEEHIDPEVMARLIAFANHRDFCERCEAAEKHGTGDFCSLGIELIQRVSEHPDVSPA